ncbi:hypothetical protein [Pseudomonas sp. NPDC089569]|uniref:hypothetical protein n=1 Tax=Pseudomonas sp. NPDC089569 TaxID=3390722 RepID=UPI003CFFB2D1
MKWRWLILFIKVWLISAFLLACLFGLGVTALLAGTDAELEWEQRIYAVGIGLITLFIGLAILRAITPTQPFFALFRKKNG